MLIDIMKTNLYAISKLKSSSQFYVHSVYDKTINICSSNTVLALQSSNVILSPTNFITEIDSQNFRKLNIQTGSICTIKNKHIIFPNSNIFFDFKNSKLIDTTSPSLNNDDVYNFIYKFNMLLKSSFISGVFTLFQNYKNNDLILNSFQNILSQAILDFHSDNFKTFAYNISKLIGLGIGLTPSGDDFICGVISYFHSTSNKNHSIYNYLEDFLQKNLYKTNPISQSFIRSSLDGFFNEPFKNLKNYSSPLEIKDNFSKIGHSSGFDFLCGFYFIANLFCTNKKC